jgi:hypothetical protein
MSNYWRCPHGIKHYFDGDIKHDCMICLWKAFLAE